MEQMFVLSKLVIAGIRYYLNFFWFFQKRDILMVFECTRKKIAFDSSAEMTVIALEKCNFE